MSVIVFLVHGCTRRTRIFSCKEIRGIREIRVQVLGCSFFKDRLLVFEDHAVFDLDLLN
jgi:hypothetical protein